MGNEAKVAGLEGRAVTGEVEVAAPIERVWQALTEAAELERWFPLEARVEPGEGGSIFMSWKNEFAGDSTILTWEPPHLLRTTWDLDGHGGAQVTEYRLEARGGRTLVRVVTSGFPADAAWDDWVEGTRLGWRYELQSLRHYLERHEGEGRAVLYLRRRVRLSPVEAWARIMSDDGLDARWRRGTLIDDEPGRQFATALDDPAGALLRVSIEPCSLETGDDRRDVTLFLSAWGAAAERLAPIEPDFRALLERLYAEGETL